MILICVYSTKKDGKTEFGRNSKICELLGYTGFLFISISNAFTNVNVAVYACCCILL